MAVGSQYCFQLTVMPEGPSRLRATDPEGQPAKPEPDATAAGEVLRMMYRDAASASLGAEWGRRAGRSITDVAADDRYLDRLRGMSAIIGPDLRPMDFAPGSASLATIVLSGADGKKTNYYYLSCAGRILTGFVPVSASYALADGTLYKVHAGLSDLRTIGSRATQSRVRQVRPRVRATLSAGIDYLEAKGIADLGAGLPEVSLAELLRSYARNGCIPLEDGSIALPDADFMGRLARVFVPADAKSGRLRLSMADIPEADTLLDSPIAGPEAARIRRFYAGLNAVADLPLALPDIRATLRPYQEAGVKWLRYCYDNRVGACLADDMGLGKTLQAIALLSTVYPGPAEPALVVMPRSLIFNWERELSRFCPALDVAVHYGQARDLRRAMRSQVILTTYATVRNDFEEFRRRRFHIIILDESQYIKNSASGVARAVTALQGPHRVALSGTPIENNLRELHSLFNFLNPGLFGAAPEFERRYEAPEARADLRRRIAPFMLRRLKGEVLAELPDRIDQILLVAPEPEQAELYAAAAARYRLQVQGVIRDEGLARGRFAMLRALNELRHLASVPCSPDGRPVDSAKLDVLTEHLLEAAANGHKSVAFFNFLDGIDIIAARLRQAGIGYETITGSTADRAAVVDRFQTDPGRRVLLMTLKTGGVGLNLTAADTVFIVEPWWNRAAEMQGIDRLHRIGQTSKVTCYSLITKGTIDEKIRELQRRKTEMVDDIITADTADGKHLSPEDIDFILS